MASLTSSLGTDQWKEASKGWNIFAFVPTEHRQELTESVTSSIWAQDDQQVAPPDSPVSDEVLKAAPKDDKVD